MGNDPVNRFDPDGGYTELGGKIARFFYKVAGKDPGPLYLAEGGGKYSYGFNTISSEGTIHAHFGANYNAPKAPDWLDNKYVLGAANIIAGHEIQNMREALETYQRDGFQAYIYHSIGNASLENRLAFATGGYGPVRGSAGAAKGGNQLLPKPGAAIT